MKSKRVLLIFVCICVAIALVASTLIMCAHSVRFATDNAPVYTPWGVANNYTDIVGISIDEHKIWEYKLNSRETEILDNEINNGYWIKATKEEYDEIKERFFSITPDSVASEAMTENIYYCLFSPSDDEMLKILEDNILLGWHRYVFIYDFETATYWCVSKSV